MHEKLLKIQQELKVPKNQINAFGKYKYRSCEDIIEAVKPLCHAQHLVLTINDEIYAPYAFYKEQVNNSRYYVKATATLSDGKEKIEVTAYAREEETKKGMDGAQITGSASSYARKYALNGLFAIDDTKDPDATNDHGKTSNDVARDIELPEDDIEL